MSFDFSRSAMVNGPVAPYTAIKGDATTPANFRVIQATSGSGNAGDACLGIAQKGEENYPGASDGLAANVPPALSQTIMYYGAGAVDVAAQIGGTVSAWQYLKSGAGGLLIACTTAGDKIVARAKQAGILNDIIDVDVICNGSEYPG
jgi:hypothetical protein